MTGNRQEIPTTVALPSRVTPSFLFSNCILCAGGTRVKRIVGNCCGGFKMEHAIAIFDCVNPGVIM